jgi:pentose-5-phosphate-3-epimerase
MATLSDETLRLIAGSRKFMKNYGIMRGLMFNPKTPLEVTLHLLPHLKPLDLKFLSTNKNVADTLRTSASRLQRRRSSERES